MSKEAAKAFMDAVGADPELKAEVAALRGADALAKMTALGKARGFTFTEAEYREAVVDYAGEQLSDEAIEALARQLRKP